MVVCWPYVKICYWSVDAYLNTAEECHEWIKNELRHLWSLIENRKEFSIRDWADALLLRMSVKRTWWVWSSKFDGGNRQEGERKQVGRETICIPMTETRRKRVGRETISKSYDRAKKPQKTVSAHAKVATNKIKRMLDLEGRLKQRNEVKTFRDRECRKDADTGKWFWWHELGRARE